MNKIKNIILQNIILLGFTVCILLTNNSLSAMQEEDEVAGRASEAEEGYDRSNADRMYAGLTQNPELLEAVRDGFVEDLEELRDSEERKPVAHFVGLKMEEDEDGNVDVSAALRDMREKIFSIQEACPMEGISINLNAFCLPEIRLHEVGDSFFEGMTNVIELDISNNQLTQEAIKQICYYLPNLLILRLDGNELTGLPAEIGRLRHLCVLSIDYNNLTELPDEFESLRTLRVLSVIKNQLTQDAMRHICQLTNLQELNLSRNKLSQEAVENIRDLKNLVSLDLSLNDLTELPVGIDTLNKLKFLNLCLNHQDLNQKLLEFGRGNSEKEIVTCLRERGIEVKTSL